MTAANPLAIHAWRERICAVSTAQLREDLHDPSTKRLHKGRIYAELLRRKRAK